jgi:hypothetical protein
MEKNNSKIKKVYTEEDIHKAFNAGVSRGVYVASVITRTPIEGDYPTYKEYIKIIQNETQNKKENS